MRIRQERRSPPPTAGWFRPIVTFLVTIGLFVSSWYLAVRGEIDIMTWFQSWMQVVMMLLGFYFATREAKKEDDRDNRR